MGGKAIGLLGYESSRMNRESHDSISNLLTERISCYRKATVFPCVFSKKDFGDIDILITGSIPATLSDIGLEPSVTQNNSPLLSFPYPDGPFYRQIDLFFVPDEKFDFALNFFSWNDAGTLLHRLLSYYRLTLSWDGLWKNPLLPDGKKERILISEDFPSVISYLGLDYETFSKGFNDHEDVFNFIYSSPFFERKAFSEEGMSKATMKNLMGRPLFRRFCSWIESQPFKSANTLDDFEKTFPIYTQRYREVLTKHQDRKLVQDMLKATPLQEMGFQGAEIGRIISLVKKELPFEVLLEKSKSMDGMAFYIEFLTTKGMMTSKPFTL